MKCKTVKINYEKNSDSSPDKIWINWSKTLYFGGSNDKVTIDDVVKIIREEEKKAIKLGVHNLAFSSYSEGEDSVRHYINGNILEDDKQHEDRIRIWFHRSNREVDRITRDQKAIQYYQAETEKYGLLLAKIEKDNLAKQAKQAVKDRKKQIEVAKKKLEEMQKELANRK